MSKINDRFKQARFGLQLVTVLMIAAAILLVTAAIGIQRDSIAITAGFIDLLNLNTPSLFPTGHRQRDIGYTHPAVNLRHSPHLPRNEPAAVENFTGPAALYRQNTP